jgi:hypothetical protein
MISYNSNLPPTSLLLVLFVHVQHLMDETGYGDLYRKIGVDLADEEDEIDHHIQERGEGEADPLHSDPVRDAEEKEKEQTRLKCEILSLAGSMLKLSAFSGMKSTMQKLRTAKLAAVLYEKACELSQDYFPAINAATLALLTGKKRRSSELAWHTLHYCARTIYSKFAEKGSVTPPPDIRKDTDNLSGYLFEWLEEAFALLNKQEQVRWR